MRAQLDGADVLDEDRLRNLSDWHDGCHGPQFPVNGATPSFLHVSGPKFMLARVAASCPSLPAWSGRRPIAEEMSIQSVHWRITGMHGQGRQFSSIGAGCGSGRRLPFWVRESDALPKRNDSAPGHPGAFRGRSGPHRAAPEPGRRPSRGRSPFGRSRARTHRPARRWSRASRGGPGAVRWRRCRWVSLWRLRLVRLPAFRVPLCHSRGRTQQAMLWHGPSAHFSAGSRHRPWRGGGWANARNHPERRSGRGQEAIPTNSASARFTASMSASSRCPKTCPQRRVAAEKIWSIMT